MSAGSGITHSEFNHSKTEPVHFLQIWILLDRKDLSPGYEQKFFTPQELHGRWRLVASPDGRDDSVTIRQNTFLYVTGLNDAESAEHSLAPGQTAYLHLARGQATVNEQTLTAGGRVAHQRRDGNPPDWPTKSGGSVIRSSVTSGTDFQPSFSNQRQGGRT
jgi:redox-sensitive bicupin YhaK (pirin superfamily)